MRRWIDLHIDLSPMRGATNATLQNAGIEKAHAEAIVEAIYGVLRRYHSDLEDRLKEELQRLLEEKRR